MNKQVCQFPTIFYIVHMDHLDMIRCWVKYGGDPNATSGLQRLPLLAFAILYTRDTRTVQQATSTVETLLMLGASPFVIPRAFYMPFNGRLPVDGSIQGELTDNMEEKQSWCTPLMRKMVVLEMVVSVLNITQRYRLWQVSKIGALRAAERAEGDESSAPAKKRPQKGVHIPVRRTTGGASVGNHAVPHLHA
ncbi:hypothetical protein F4824DRAFT_475013 [Ustulina deusta]|nr:hypothetical protein F4824DRAFT_475013 [Ustulina deusta]